MQNTVTNNYSLNLEECAKTNLINRQQAYCLVARRHGQRQNVRLTDVGKGLPNHMPCYVDCTTKDLGDIMMPKFKTNGEQGLRIVRTQRRVRFAHQGQAYHHGLDEYGKTNKSVKMALTRLTLERQLGNNKLHPDSIVFATTNKGSEGVGDILEPHQRDR